MSESTMSGDSDPGPGDSDPKRRAEPTNSGAKKRASRACQGCRFKHVKCDGILPQCTRCREEKKSCHYVPSRRGIRNAETRARMHNEAITATLELPTETKAARPPGSGWTQRPPSSAGASSQRAQLRDLYYAYFHDTHPWLPPKETLTRLGIERPKELELISNMISYVGSVFSKDIETTPFRQTALRMACGDLECTVFNVQALLCIYIATFGEGEDFDLAGRIFDQAMKMAQSIGLHRKEFADAEGDPLLAESYRRTFWAIFVHGSLRTVREHRGHFHLFSTQVTTELPCEEWEYQTGNIPPPRSLAQFHQDTSQEYSSWAYLAALSCLAGQHAVPLLNVGQGADPVAVEFADNQIGSWLLRLPRWKLNMMDAEGVADMVLFHALGIAHGLRIRIQLQLHNAGVEFRPSNIMARGPIFSSSLLLPHQATNPWVYGTEALKASLELVGLFKFRLPPEKLSPSCIHGIERAVLPMLDAYTFGAGRNPLLKEKIVGLARVLDGAGEYWPLSKSFSRDILQALEACETTGSEGGVFRPQNPLPMLDEPASQDTRVDILQSLTPVPTPAQEEMGTVKGEWP